MRRRMQIVVAFVAAVMAMPGVARAQTPTEDSVTGQGDTGENRDFVFNINATSGPSGEDPTGHVALFAFETEAISGPVTCLAVTGPKAVIGFHDDGIFAMGQVIVEVQDNGPADSGLDSIGVEFFGASRSPSDCSPINHGEPVAAGDIVVHDARPFPFSKDQCENSGWRSFGVFKNQGDCDSFVATRGKNPPGSKP